MKRPLAYITAAWYGGDTENAELAAQYCRAVYDAGFAPICPALFLPLFLNDAVPEEHKSSIDIGRDLLRRSRVLVVCGHTVTESMKNDIAVRGARCQPWEIQRGSAGRGAAFVPRQSPGGAGAPKGDRRGRHTL